MHKLSIILILVISSFFHAEDIKKKDPALLNKAKELSEKFLIIDTHIDVPYRLRSKWDDVSERTERGHFDYPRAIEGGLNSAFMSIYIPARFQKTGGSKELADTLIDMVENIAEQHPDKFAVAKSTKDVFKYKGTKIITLPLGIENGSAIEGSFENLKHFYDRGVRYITLSHSKVNNICDSSYDPERKWNGLSPFGKSLIKEMNKLGIMIDISHVTDSTFYQVIKLTETPVIASHSSCRYFTPGFERNMSDEMIKKLAANGGVIQITFGSYFVSGDYKQKMAEMGKYLKEHNIGRWSDEGKEYFKKFIMENKVDFGSAEILAEHIDHVVKLVGIDHVGFGSDFEGVSDLPVDVQDVSSYPNIIYELLKKGYNEVEIEKICSGNLLRVWKEVEDYADHLN